MRALLVLSVTFLVAGCRDQCNWKTDPGMCDGNSTVTCDMPGVDQLVPNRYRTRPCGQQVCVVAGQQAFCTVDGGLSALCDGGSAETCDGRTRVICLEGFETDRVECLSCRDAGVCEGGPSSRCSSGADCASGFCRDAGSAAFCATP